MNDLEILNQQAIDAAISHNWEQAVALNQKILDVMPQSLEANLRLGFAYLQLEEMKKSKKYYQLALKIQSKNPVALENLERISILEEKKTKNPIKVKATLNPSLFLEIPGKTKSVVLVNLGQKNHLAELDIGEPVELKVKKRKVEVRTTSGDYIGYLPDDLSKRLIFFIQAKSVYSAYVKEANPNRVVIFIKEIKKGPKVAHHSSFPSHMSFNLEERETDEDANANEEEDIAPEEEAWQELTHDVEKAANEDEFHVQSDEDEEEE